MTEHPRDDLAALAVGALGEHDRERVASHVAGCDTCRAELAAHERSVWALAEADQRPLPAGLRRKVLATERRRARSAGLAGLLQRPVPLGATLALALALIVSLGALAQTRAEVATYDRAVAALVAGRVVTLAPERAGSEVHGTLAVAPDGSAHLLLRVPAPPAGKTWQAWVVRGERALPAGITGDRGGVVTLPLAERVAAGDVVAVTLEDAGGVPLPRGAIVLSGRT